MRRKNSNIILFSSCKFGAREGRGQAPTEPFEEGDLFALLTDGLTETANNREHLLGIQPLEECIGLDMDKPLAGIEEAIFDRARNHGTARDDQTILLIRIKNGAGQFL